MSLKDSPWEGGFNSVSVHPLLTIRPLDTVSNNNKSKVNRYYYTTRAVRGPITKINQSKCSIAGPIFSKYWTGHCPEWSRMIPHLCPFELQSYNKSLINQACSGPYWKNIGPRSFLYGPRCARSVLSRPRADILPVRPSRLVNKTYLFNYVLSKITFDANLILRINNNWQVVAAIGSARKFRVNWKFFFSDFVDRVANGNT